MGGIRAAIVGVEPDGGYQRPRARALAHDQQAPAVLSTWTDELNAALHPLGILLSGEDATSIFPELARGSPLEVLRSVTDTQIAQIAEAANQYCETD